MPAPELGEAWRLAREPAPIRHLDAAAAARTSRTVIAAMTDYLLAETTTGAYIALEAAAETLTGGRAVLAGLLDPALTAADVAYHHSASDAFAALVEAWPLPRGARVGVVPSAFASNLLTLQARAVRDGLELVDLPVLADGLIDVDALARGDGPAALSELDLVTFPEVPSQRGTVQPTAAVAALCRDAGVPVLLDVAQSLGQIDVTAAGATGGIAAYVGTSRKWLCGPRGAGFLAVRPEFVDRLAAPSPSGYNSGWQPRQDGRAGGQGGAGPAGTAGTRPSALTDGRIVPAAGMTRFHLGEAPVAAQVGFAAALAELAAAGPALVRERLHALGAAARRRLDGVAGWRIGEDVATPTAIVTLLPPPGLDPAVVRSRLYAEHGVLTTAIGADRARDAVPALRVSPHVYNTLAEVDHLAEALAQVSRQP
ncbi:MAG: aminotransferase class V-fold PLP-dependent enzyme [Frankia sp.]|nr:aminotransferase class V-fold PLP-dependent enzyme [Frankia sp.]